MIEPIAALLARAETAKAVSRTPTERMNDLELARAFDIATARANFAGTTSTVSPSCELPAPGCEPGISSERA